jgi:hypothetical protein
LHGVTIGKELFEYPAITDNAGEGPTVVNGVSQRAKYALLDVH